MFFLDGVHGCPMLLCIIIGSNGTIIRGDGPGKMGRGCVFQHTRWGLVLI